MYDETVLRLSAFRILQHISLFSIQYSNVMNKFPVKLIDGRFLKTNKTTHNMHSHHLLNTFTHSQPIYVSELRPYYTTMMDQSKYSED